MFLYEGLKGSLHLPYIYMATTARNLVHNSQLLLQRVLVLDSRQLSMEDGCQSEDCLNVVSSAYSSHVFARACYIEDKCCCLGLFCWLSRCVGCNYSAEEDYSIVVKMLAFDVKNFGWN